MNEKGQKVHFELVNFVKKLKDSWWKSIFSLNSVDTFGDVCRSIWAIYNQWPLVLHWRGLQEPLQQHIYPFPLKYPSAAKLWAGNEGLPLSKLLNIHILDFHSQPLKRVGGNPLPILIQSPIKLHMYNVLFTVMLYHNCLYSKKWTC